MPFLNYKEQILIKTVAPNENIIHTPVDVLKVKNARTAITTSMQIDLILHWF